MSQKKVFRVAPVKYDRAKGVLTVRPANIHDRAKLILAVRPAETGDNVKKVLTGKVGKYDREKKVLALRPAHTHALRSVLNQMGYCRLCCRPRGRLRKIGEAAKFFGGRTRVVLCEPCWLEVQPLIRPLRAVYKNQRRLQEKLNGKTT